MWAVDARRALCNEDSSWATLEADEEEEEEEETLVRARREVLGFYIRTGILSKSFFSVLVLNNSIYSTCENISPNKSDSIHRTRFSIDLIFEQI